MAKDSSGLATPRGRYTRTGIRRSGDDYQDLCAIEFVVEMLEHPERYQWVKVEADEVGALDDILALRQDQSYIARQVKYSGHPDDDGDAWTWEKFLVEKQGDNGKSIPSLLSRWFRSWQQLKAQGAVAEASLDSNRKAREDLREIIDPNGVISFDSIPQEIQVEIFRQFGNKEAAREFFSEFRFRVDRPELEVLSEGLSRRFFALGGTREGWLSLKDQLRQWVRERYEPPPDGSITITVVRSASNWHHLKTLPENFEVPEDYVLPSQSFHDNFLRSTVQRVRSCQVLKALPALGKSTYLSYLVGKLEELNVPVVRHHYFLRADDRSYGRFDHNRIAESLMNDLLVYYPKALGNLASRNPNPEELGAWLTAAGTHFTAQHKPLVVVIDGLDHVWREKDSREELTLLFEHLLPTPDGVVIVVGTQPVDDDQLPPSLLRECARDQWIELELFDRDAVAAWLEKHEDELDLPAEAGTRQNFLDELATAFYTKTEGHPLHLRFILGSLIDQGQGITARTVADLPGAPGKDIMKYYSALWSSIPECGRNILHLFACTKFPWPLTGIVEAMDTLGTDLVTINSAYRQIQHLLIHTQLGLRPFHSSLLIFVQSQQAHSIYAGPMRSKARQWLANRAPYYWRWAYAWLLDDEDGQTNHLIDGPSRAWMIDSLSRGYPCSQMIEILGRSALSALEKGQLGRFVELALLKDYLEWQEPQALLGIQLALGQDQRLRDISLANADSLASLDIVSLARFEANQGNSAAVKMCFDTLNSPRPHEDNAEKTLEWAQSLMTVAALLPTIELNKLVKFVHQFRRNGRSIDVLNAFARSLRVEKDMSRFRELLSVSQLSPDEHIVVRKHAVGLAFEAAIEIGIIDMQRWDDPYSAIYRFLRSKHDASPVTSWPPWTLLDRSENTFLSRRSSIAHFFHMAYYALLASFLREESRFIDDWISQSPTPYIRDLLNRTKCFAAETATSIRDKTSMPFSIPYKHFENAQRPRHWIDDREASEIADGIQDALSEIAFNLVYLQREWSTSGMVSIDDMREVFSSPFSERWYWVTSYVQYDKPFLPEPTLAWLINEFEADIDHTIGLFPTIAERYSKLATVSAMHGRGVEELDRLLHKVISNTIAYGSHKDMLICSMLDVAESCHQNGIEGTNRWLLSLAPVIAHIDDFTDGDETNYLPQKLGESIAKVSPNRLPGYYLWLCGHEEYSDARSVFNELISIMDISDPICRAIARTALDQGSLRVLHERAEGGDLVASDILREITALLGTASESAEGSAIQDTVAISTESKDSLPHANDYPPPQIREFLRACNAKRAYESFEYIKIWLEFWDNHEQGLRSYESVRDLADTGREVRNSDLMASLARKYCGPAEAYRWIALANRDEMGWSQYYTKKQFAEARWAEIKRSYPDRWLQFIRDTVVRTHVDQWHGVTAQHYVLRLVEYCIFMEYTDHARAIAEKVLATIHELTSPVQFTSPEWADTAGTENDGTARNNMCVLLSRLTWPSVLVRERTAVAMAELMSKESAVGEQTENTLIAWIKKQNIESTAALGILVFCRLADQHPERLPEQGTIFRALGKPSLLSFELLRYLYGDIALKPDWMKCHSGPVTTDFEPPQFFKKFRNNFLPPIYSSRVEQVQDRTLLPLFRQWAFEWTQLVRTLGCEPSAQVLDFGGRPPGLRMFVDFSLSEVYRSAYLRSIAWAVTSGKLSEEAALFLALEACPVDLGLWRVQPGIKPQWWPTPKSSSGTLDTVPAQIWTSLSSLWDRRREVFRENVLLAASGSVHQGSAIYSLSIRAMFQIAQGTASGEPREIMQACDNAQGNHSSDGAYFGGILNPINPEDIGLVSNDWSILPASVYVRPSVFPRWQYWRGYRGIQLPASFLALDRFSFHCELDSIHIADGTSPIGSWRDWTDGVTEEFIDGVPPPHGWALEISSDLVDRFARQTRSTLCWICELKVLHREHQHEIFKEFSTFQLHGTTNIILPS